MSNEILKTITVPLFKMSYRLYNSKAPMVQRPIVDSAKLKAAMKKSKFTYRSLADAVGLSYNAVWCVVQGTARVSPDNLHKICRAVGIDPKDVYLQSSLSVMQVDHVKVLRLMGERGVSTYQVAGRAGIPQSAVRSLLDGCEPKATALKKICDLLGMDINDAFISIEMNNAQPEA